jgi:putative oxidoreductase
MNMQSVVMLWNKVTAALDAAGAWVGLLALRLLLAWEFWESGLEKYRGENWFADIQDRFPFPFSVLPVDLSWFLATWIELIGAWALVLGFATRIVSAKLMVLTVVAIAAVHWPMEWSSLGELLQGYAIRDEGYGNYKLPLIYLVMFVPLLLSGPGRLSVDHLMKQRYAR